MIPLHAAFLAFFASPLTLLASALTLLDSAPVSDDGSVRRVDAIETTPAQAAPGRQWVVAPEGGDFTDLAAGLAAAQDGDTLLVRGGVHRGPLVVERAVALAGVDWPVLDGGGTGTVLTFAVPGGGLSGFVVRNSGSMSEKEDAGVLAKGTVNLTGNRLEDVLYGFDIQTAPNSVIADNVVQGRELEIARRGDAIRLWESRGSRVERNRLIRARDMVIWYSEAVSVTANSVTDCRYGLHFMYASGSLVSGNRFEDNGVGAYAMYSSGLHYERNLFLRNHGVSGYGLGLKDSDDIVVRDNLIAANRIGVYFDNSPARSDSVNQVTGNTVSFNDIGMAFTPAVKHNRLGGNNFTDNFQQVAVLGSGTFAGNDWTPDGKGNYWSNYNGYDADNDGVGDLPYQEVSLFGSLLEDRPVLRLFVQSPAQDTLDLAARAFPVFRPAPLLTDQAPRTRPYPLAVGARAARPVGLVALAAGLLALATMVGAWGAALDRHVAVAAPARSAEITA